MKIRSLLRRDLWGLALPYLCALVVVALLVHGALREESISVVGMSDAASCEGLSERGGTHLDPVCRMVVGTGITAVVSGTSHAFCNERCRELFVADPEKYLADNCIVCRASGVFTPVDPSVRESWEGNLYRFCVPGHRDAFRVDPGGYFLHTMWGVPSWLYYASIGLVMVLSFAFLEWRGEARTRPGRRLDLLRWRPLRWLMTRPQTRFVIQALSAGLFLLIIVAGLFGNQLPSKNIAPILTWTIWWGGLVLVILFLGKAFCYACPWDALAGWLESLRPWGAKRDGLGLGLRAPRWARNVWAAIFLFVVLTWIELGLGVTLKPRATAYLALLMLGMAVVSALVFERRFFCRSVCLVGRISGLYALFSPIEVRSIDESVCQTCTTQSCYKGNDQGVGCPTAQFPGTMPNNTYCTMCMECLRTCEPANMTIRLRPWGEDLKSVRRPRLDEACLALSLLALSAFHGLTMTGAWRRLMSWMEETFGAGRIVSFTVLLVMLSLGISLVYAVLVAAARGLGGSDAGGGPRRRYRDDFVRYSYALLPIAFFYHLAHNAEHLLMEGQKVVALLSDPLGREWNLFGTAGLELPPVANLSTLWGVQVFLVLVGHVFGVWATCKVTEGLHRGSRERLLAHLPLLVAMILFSVLSLWLLKQPMEMRTSAM